MEVERNKSRQEIVIPYFWLACLLYVFCSLSLSIFFEDSFVLLEDCEEDTQMCTIRV